MKAIEIICKIVLVLAVLSAGAMAVMEQEKMVHITCFYGTDQQTEIIGSMENYNYATDHLFLNTGMIYHPDGTRQIVNRVHLKEDDCVLR